MAIDRQIMWKISLLFLALSNPVYAHYPHDVNYFIALSPDFSLDSTAFAGQKQGASIRPNVALVSRDKGLSWDFNPAGMDNLSKFMSAIASPLFTMDHTVFMTTESDGIYRSMDSGNSWAKVNNGLPTLRLKDSAAGVDASGTVVVFVSGMGGGLFRSSDLGASWESVVPENVVISAFTVSPAFAEDHVVLAGGYSGSLLLSMDGGTTFSQLDSLAGVSEITQIVFAPDFQNSREIYIGTTIGLYYSNNAGVSFAKVDSFGNEWISALALSPAYRTDLTIFASTPTNGIFKSTDAGLNWSLHATGITLSGQATYHYMDIQLSDDFPNDGIVFLAMFEGLFRSDDGGLTWAELETRPPTLITDVSLSPDFAQDGLMLASTYGGGLYVSHDAGVSWEVSNTGIIETHVYRTKIIQGTGSSNVPSLLAVEKNLALISFDGGASWTRREIAGVLPGPCLTSALDASSTFALDQTMFVGCRTDGLVVTRDGGNTWETSISPTQMSGRTLTSVKLSPNYETDATVFFADTLGVFARSQDGGNNWQGILNGLPNPGGWFGGTSIAISPDFTAVNYIVAGTAKGFFGSIDAGDSWWRTPDSASPVASGIIEDVEISPDFNQDYTVLASVRGKGLFRSSNVGLSWQQVGQGLLERGYQLTGFRFSPNFSNDGVIIGFGYDHLFRSTDRGNSFELIDIPLVRHENSRKQSVRYLGYWVKLDLEAASAMSFNCTWTAGNQVSLTFRGTGVKWVGFRAKSLGIAEVYLDNNLVGTVDQYNQQTLSQQVLYSIEGLPLGEHEIRIMATNRRNPAATFNLTTIDAFDVVR